MPFCTRCGTAVEDGSSCRFCGGTPPPAPMRAFFHGDGMELLKIHLVNILLTICTLGVYYFWARARVRRYEYGQTSFANARFSYHGTGWELLRGWLKAAAVFAVLVGILILIQSVIEGEAGQAIASLAIYALIIPLGPVVIVGTWRYWLSRSAYRGIRFSWRGTLRAFFPIYLKGVLLSLVTLGFYSPYFLNDLRKSLTNGARFGSARFHYDGEGRPLLWPYVKNLLLLIPTLGIYSFWFRAELQRHYWNHTSFAGARFRCDINGGGLLSLTAINVLLVFATAGLATPWAKIRAIQYQLDHVWLEGNVDFDSVVQSAVDAEATGEELGDMLDLGVDIGL